MRIFRTIILLTGITALMPSPPENAVKPNSASAQAEKSAVSLLGSAATAVADLAGLCGREPKVCEAAGYVASRIETKAKYSAKLIYEWANESSGQPSASPLNDQANSDPMATGSTVIAEAGDGNLSTLTLEDMIPTWRGPTSHNKS